MTIRYEEKMDDDQLMLSIEEDTALLSMDASMRKGNGANNSRTVKEEAFVERRPIRSPSPSPCGVRFGHVSIRQYPVIVGDNPAVSGGPPLSIGWEYDDEVTLDVVEYEEQRPPRRKGREMLVPTDVRTDRLREAGYSRAEIVALTKPVNLARSQRRRTLDTLHLQPLYQLHEKLSRKTFSLLTGGRRKKSERHLLSAHRPESSAGGMRFISSSHSIADDDAQSVPRSTATVEEDDRSSAGPTVSLSPPPEEEEELDIFLTDSEDGMVCI
jgi:hypothetical protein